MNDRSLLFFIDVTFLIHKTNPKHNSKYIGIWHRKIKSDSICFAVLLYIRNSAYFV